MTEAEIRAKVLELLPQTSITYAQWINHGKSPHTVWAIIDSLLRTKSPIPTPVPVSTNPVPPPASGAFFAALIEGKDTYNHYYPVARAWYNPPWDMSSWDRFEQNAGKKIWGLMTGDGEAWNGSFEDINYILMQNAARGGTVPIIDSDPSKGATLSLIASGGFDENIISYARVLANSGKPLVLRPWCEMNGSWYRYAIEAHTNPMNFVNAWKRLVSVIRSVAPNVSFHWCPNIDPENLARYTPLEQLWPGDEYVDWAGFTGYRHAADESVQWGFQSTYDRVAALTKKPMMIGEVASADITPYPGNKVEFINTFFSTMMTKWPQIKAFCWFNWYIYENDVYWDWPIESSPQVLTAFKSMMSKSYFVGRP